MQPTAHHTPGPWLVEPLQSTDGADMAICAPGNGWIVAVIQHDPDIQTIANPDAGTVVWHPQDHANARLIAAAPSLLAALQYIEPWARGAGMPTDQCRAAIAAATGEGEA